MTQLDHDLTVKQDPRRMSGVQLARLGVQILNRYDLVLKCVTCGETWSPQVDRKGALVAGYWCCPNRCNV
jgi:hypothetical protein